MFGQNDHGTSRGQTYQVLSVVVNSWDCLP